MGLNLRLSLLRLRQKINFRLMRILLVFLYMAITASVLIYHFHSASEPLEELVVVEGGRERMGSRGAEFVLTGGQDEDFRRNGFQVRSSTKKQQRIFDWNTRMTPFVPCTGHCFTLGIPNRIDPI